jgi:iron(III) transport system permease protein
LGRLVRAIYQHSLMIAALAFLLVALVYPLGLTVAGAFAADPSRGIDLSASHLLELLRDPSLLASEVTLRPLALVFEDPALLRGLGMSAALASVTTLASVLLAAPLAFVAARYAFPLKRLFSAAVLVPLILPPFVGAMGVRAIMGRAGALNALFGTEFDFLGRGRFWGVVIVEALHLYPVIYLNLTAALANLDPALDEAAENLGAGFWMRLRRVTLPLVRPGLFAGATLVFIWSLTELGTPLMFEYNAVTPVQIFNKLKEVESSAEPYALTVVMLVLAVSSYGLGRLVLGGRAYAMYSKASHASAERRLGFLGGAGAVALFASVTLVAVLPHVGVVLTSLTVPGQWYRTVLPSAWTTAHYTQALGAPESFGSIVNSLKYSAWAVGANLVLGLTIGYLIVRTRLRGRALLDALSMLPLAVPGLVLAFGYVAVTLRWPFGHGGPLEGWVSVIAAQPNPVPLLIVAYAVRRLPYMVRATVTGLEQTFGELEEAALNLGASRFTAIRRIIVPLIAANLVAGSLLVFSFSMLAVSESMILVQQVEDFPITRALYAFSDRLGDGMYIASAMGVWGMALLAVTLIAASMLLGKRLGALFRV